MGGSKLYTGIGPVFRQKVESSLLDFSVFVLDFTIANGNSERIKINAKLMK